MGDRLTGRVAIVTGSGGGIGREHARLLAAEGASVVVNDLGTRSGASAADVVAEITDAGGTAVANTDSAGSFEGAAAIVATAVEAFGRIDILVNNATAGHNNDLWRYTEEEWDRTVDVNLKGYFAMIRAATPHLVAHRDGVIVNTSSGSGFGHPSFVAYSSAKEGVIGLTRTVARELGRFGVRCNAIRPMAVGTSSEEYQVRTARWTDLINITMAPPGAAAAPPTFDPDANPPRKVAPMVVWLCTDAARNVTGRTFHVAGDTVSILSEPKPEQVIYQAGGWDLDSLDAVVPSRLTGDLTNRYTLDDRPDLQVFEP